MSLAKFSKITHPALNDLTTFFCNFITFKADKIDLSNTHCVITEFTSIVLNTDFAKETFGQNQALSRIISIEILLEGARNLNPEPLRETLVSLNQRFSGTDPDLGQRQDLEELLSGYLQILIPEFPQGPDSALDEIGFSKNLETIFMVAVLNNGGRKHYDEAMKILKNYLDLDTPEITLRLLCHPRRQKYIHSVHGYD